LFRCSFASAPPSSACGQQFHSFSIIRLYYFYSKPTVIWFWNYADYKKIKGDVTKCALSC
jgi:hypothetical protein